MKVGALGIKKEGENFDTPSYKLCIKYTANPEDIDDNYVEVLTNFFKYIETYDPTKSIQTWLHIVTKRYIIDADVDNRSAVCVIGPELAEDLFGTTNVVGNTLHIDGRKFRIVGVLESKGTSMGGSSDNTLVLPFTLAQRMLDSTTISSIYISAVDSASVDKAQEVVESFLYKKYQNALFGCCLIVVHNSTILPNLTWRMGMETV